MTKRQKRKTAFTMGGHTLNLWDKCLLKGCDRTVHAKRLCRKHYDQMRNDILALGR